MTSRLWVRRCVLACGIWVLVLGLSCMPASATTVRTVSAARAYLAGKVPGPAPLFLTPGSARRVLHHVHDVQFYSGSGEDFSATVLYRPFDGGAYEGQVGITRLPDESLSRVMGPCRVRGHQVIRRRVGRYSTRYCRDDITFYYAWRWQHRI